MNFEYVIVGDTHTYTDCLVYVCGANKDRAEQILKRMNESPTENDIKVIGECTNLKIKKVENKNCWWNDSFLAN